MAHARRLVSVTVVAALLLGAAGAAVAAELKVALVLAGSITDQARTSSPIKG